MQVAANILVLTALYALISCGYVLVYRVSRVLNLAHGELMMVGAYILMTVVSAFGGHPVVTLVSTAVLSLAVGLVIYLGLMRRMTGESVFAAVIVTVALGILLRGLVSLIFTDRVRYPLESIDWQVVPIMIGDSAVITSVGMATIVAAIAVYTGLYLFFRFTRWGVRMRAVGENPLLAAQRGIELHGIYALAWGLSTFTGGLAGILLSLDNGLDSSMVIIGLKAFPAVLVGGLDSLLGAIIGSFIVAAAEILAIHHIDPLVSDVIPFLVLIVMLMFRPWGLFGTKEEFERV